MSWKDASFVLKSSKRKEILLLLETPKTPTQIAKTMRSSLPNVSLKLADLTDKGLAICLNPGEAKGRIYQLTDRGRKTLKTIKAMES